METLIYIMVLPKRKQMLHWKSFAGSIVLAGLILQGCGGSSSSDTPLAQEKSQTLKQFNASTDFLASAPLNSTDKAQVQSDLTLKIAHLDATDSEMQALVDSIIADNEEIVTRMDAYKAIAESMAGGTTTASGAPSRSIFSNITDKVKDALVDVLDTPVGNKITGAAFDVVLNSDGVTVFMLDQARNSETISQIMVDAIEAKWSLTEKMCPMLRENSEFGEKFTALAEERDFVGRFFFERIDANMYGCLTDAMLLSNNEAVHDESVSHSTNGYMALLMDRYATDYFIQPTGSTAERRADKFVSLLLNTGENVIYDRDAKTFENHGDGNELTNEKFFYSLFKTPTTTDSFVSAMDKVDSATRTMLMDNIFLGTKPVGEADTVQGYLNIVAIGTAMYDGIYGVADADGNRTGAYGFGAYTDAFIGFAKLIPNDRYLAYGKAFISAGYEYALFHGIDVWDGATAGLESLWNSYTGQTDNSTVAPSPARSGGAGIVSTNWYDDSIDLFLSAWSNVSLGDLFDALVDGDKSVLTELSDQGDKAYSTIIDGRDKNGSLAYPTQVQTTLTFGGDTVYGYHGLIELAIREDMVNSGVSANMAEAETDFTLPPFSELTWSFAYNTAVDGITTYWNDEVDTAWLADLSTNDLIREYFYPDATNAYIPSWMLAIDWLKLPNTATTTGYETIDFDFNAGYLDVYFVTSDANADVTVAFGVIEKVEMGDDTIVAVDENGQLDGLYVYKIRVVNPEDTASALAYLEGLGNDALNAIGIDASNASNVDTTTAQ